MNDSTILIYLIGFLAVSLLVSLGLLAIIWVLNRKTNTAIRKADFVEQNLLDLKYR